MEKQSGKYYLGLDIGTNSVGYAVTDQEYHVLNYKGRAMWGSRLFDEALQAEERRTYRTTRRRLQRRRWRIELLQELFAEEISKVDMGFYQRIKDSMLWAEDKTECQKYSLFNDEEYTDADFYEEYPTIYHLRRSLITENKEFDIRLVYIALHHLIKHRGHFLFQGSIENATSFETAYETFCRCMQDELELEINCLSESEMAETLKDRSKTKKDKNTKIMKLLQCDKKDKKLKAVIGLMCGLTVKLADLFEDDKLADIEKPSISFAADSYEELKIVLEQELQERCIVLDVIKALYDWAVLADILQGGEYEGNSYLSIAKTASYEKHRKDLQLLKTVLKNADEDVYRGFFQREGKDNYSAYVGFCIRNGKKIKVKKCSYEDLKKNIKKLLVTYYKDSDDANVEYILKELDQETFLPVQVTKDNGVIPYQVNEIELKKILKNAEKYLPFLSQKDESGLTVSEKVIKIFEFRVPYYVGPLNVHQNEHAWAVRKEAGKVMPWNVENKIDFDKSGEQFIRRMTNKCTYLIGKDVLPKYSLLYCEYMVWNEINNIKINGEKIPAELKQKMFDFLFKQKKNVKRKDIVNFFKAEGLEISNEQVTGIDVTIKSSLTSYHDFRKIFGSDINKYQIQNMVEDIICWMTVYGDEEKMLKRVIRKNYTKEQIDDVQLKKIVRIHYQGWGRLSREFLNGIEGADRETGELYTIISALRNTNDNLMQLLSNDKYTFMQTIKEENALEKKTISGISYENLLKDRMAAPGVKRSIWQSVLIVEEIKKIMRAEPEKIFVEMARGEGEKKRTVSRKNNLMELYRNIRDEERDWVSEIDKKDEKDFRSIKLYLYYTQMGRCMYTGKPIDLSELNDATVYDRDHIYPQSKTKDDSLDNLVLVSRVENAKKSDGMISAEIQQKMQGFWNTLKGMRLISERKYERLMRKTPLTNEELAGFINRQLVETSQSSKLTAEIVSEICPNSKVVYVKAGRVSEFRKDNLKLVKVRSLNDYHHAKDAYLNIVAGNVYYEKFTNNPLQWLKNTQDKNYSLNRMYDYDLEKNGQVIWKRGKDGTIKTVLEQMHKNNIQYTRKAYINKTGQNGGFFDQNPVSADNNPGVELKKGLDVKKYGGYKTLTAAYFSLVESEDKKGNLIRSIESVPLYLVSQFENGTMKFEEYCEKVYHLKNPRVILKKIKKDACIVINRFPMHLRGKNERTLLFQGGVQLCLSEEQEWYLKKVEKYVQRNQMRLDKKKLLELSEWDGITIEENERLYQVLYGKLKNTIYQYRANNQCETIEKGYEKFQKLSCEEQCLVLNEILWLMKCKPNTSDLKLIGGSSMTGTLRLNKIISKFDSVILKNQSITGLYEQTIDLLHV